MSHPVGTTSVRSYPAPVAMTLLSITCVQLSDALSVPMIGTVGAAGSAWIRLTLGAVLLMAIVRPDVRVLNIDQWRSIIALGVLCAALSTSFMSALKHLPLGTAVAIEFLGPLAVALLHQVRGRRSGGVRRVALRWPLIALVGVVALTEPWHGEMSIVGVSFALLAAACWAGTIMLTPHVGAEVPGMEGIALAMCVAASALAPWGASQAGPHLGWEIFAVGVGLAVLMPVLPYVLELTALRRLPQATFATLMAFEPALAVVIGAAALGQRPTALSAMGVLLVVAAGVGVTSA